MSYSVGLYLGFDFVDLVALEGSKEKFKIVKSVRTPVYEEIPSAAPRGKGSASAVAIQKSFEIAGLKTKGVNFGAPQEEVIVRRFVMPYLPPEERPNAVRFEAQKYMPFKLDEIVSAFYITEESRVSKSMEVVFVAVNKQAMERYSGIFKELNIKLNIVDISPTALSRLLFACKKLTGDKTKVVIYIEKNRRASVIIIKEKDVYLVREVGYSTANEAFFGNVLNNVRLSIDYFKRETKEVDVNDIIICADSKLPELEIYLKENIASARVEVFELDSQIEGLSDLSKKQMVAIGLAMASMDKPGPKINLADQLPKAIALKDVAEYKPLIIEGIALFLVLALLQTLGYASLSLTKRKVDRLKAKRMAAVTDTTGSISQEALRNMENKYKSQIEFLKDLVGSNRFFLTKKLSSLGSFLPEGSWVESLQFTDEIDKARKLTVNGMIYSSDKNETIIANKMLTDMKGSKDFSAGFEDMKLSSLEKAPAYEKEVLAFFIECIGQPLKSAGTLKESTAKPDVQSVMSERMLGFRGE